MAERLDDDPEWTVEDFDMKELDDPQNNYITSADATAIEGHQDKIEAAKVAWKVIKSQEKELMAIIEAARKHFIEEEGNFFRMFA